MQLPQLADWMAWQDFLIHNTVKEMFVVQTRIDIEKNGAGNIEKISSIGMGGVAKVGREEVDLEDRMILRAFQHAEESGRLRKVLKKTFRLMIVGRAV